MAICMATQNNRGAVVHEILMAAEETTKQILSEYEQKIRELSEANDLLRVENAALNARPEVDLAPLQKYETFLDLITPDIEWQEQHLTKASSKQMIEKINAFRDIRPKEAAKK